ncbi:MAG: hypothetical protein KH135_05105 [Firmicutes bacterium]|nr:hypothetical protein [Bacillota bacterium]
MKYIFVLGIFFVLTVTGCTKKETLPKEAKTYHQVIRQLEQKKMKEQELPCHLEVRLEKTEHGEIMYTVILDEPKEEMKQIEALFMPLDNPLGTYPSIGIFDDKLSMIPGKVDKEHDIVKGIVLSGYLDSKKEVKDYHGTFRLYLHYQTKENREKTIYYEKKI